MKRCTVGDWNKNLQENGLSKPKKSIKAEF